VNKKVILGIILGMVLVTSVVSLVFQIPTGESDIGQIKDIEVKRESQLNIIDNASVAWQDGAIGDEQFAEIINQAIIDTDALREEYLTLKVPSKYDRYKQLSLDSLDKQKEAFIVLREYVGTNDASVRESLRADFDQLLVSSFEYRRDALRELDS
jgi:hypothetical protein